MTNEEKIIADAIQEWAAAELQMQSFKELKTTIVETTAEKLVPDGLSEKEVKEMVAANKTKLSKLFAAEFKRMYNNEAYLKDKGIALYVYGE